MDLDLSNTGDAGSGYWLIVSVFPRSDTLFAECHKTSSRGFENLEILQEVKASRSCNSAENMKKKKILFWLYCVGVQPVTAFSSCAVFYVLPFSQEILLLKSSVVFFALFS
jgi:hypothetical protein